MPTKKASKTVKKTLAVKNPEPRDIKSSGLAGHKKQIIIGLLAVIVIGLIYYFKGVFVVATVNGTPITSLSFYQELQKADGKKTLNNIISKMLVMQEAQKRNLKVADSEVKSEIKKIEETVTKQGQKLDTLLVSQGMTRADLEERIRLQKLVDKMISKDVNITDAEINDFISKNQASIPEGSNPADTKEQVKQQLKQQKYDSQFQKLLDDLQKKAKIKYFISQ
ncbi:MAG: hypothetical protein COX79_00940 [Candidatus Levybacteria bacterium CG_4_10_14_0_2_um_filter_36_16]|nr:MAG: hypothetical protein AUK12_03730 [Candidatus Levybacteria bacterium CG2_30_37_29]PIR79185.1 MAG: hypothetical protein COU26_02525 [Candidatus Levybacteria bacterium CG10_big_fil_rev_8_21_14_0_10_36_30]PIZ97707.1 MAG: hypothetical protein COX79_00940 [Candidatus Levybacteria bacterium CG_4_10_14_0_2_um_filter_36_16]PJA90830.1 MAG: hypothetical protein CO136_00425 [Candidatus Levybacteria bacterium CG_4_9_14_3_um_filter_36_7]